jgi:hypothetical protein
MGYNTEGKREALETLEINIEQGMHSNRDDGDKKATENR